MRMRFRTLPILLTLLLPLVVSAQDQPTPPEQPKPPAATGEEEANKPTRGFVSALIHNLSDDVKHMPRVNTAYWLAGGAVASLAVHPADDRLNQKLVGSSGAKEWWFRPGRVIGATPTVLGAGATFYVVGRVKGWTRAQHLGMDEIESALLAEGIVQGAKQIARRQRPLRADGTRQSGFSFPSGHSTITFAAATVLQQHLGYRAGLPTYAVASYVAISRLHDNRHFLSDVVFGAATGVVIGRSVTWHGRNFYASPMLLPGGGGIQISARHDTDPPSKPAF